MANDSQNIQYLTLNEMLKEYGVESFWRTFFGFASEVLKKSIENAKNVGIKNLINLDKEKEIYRHQARELGKPENMLEKIAQGALNKFFKENTLLNQDFVKDNKMTIRQYLGSIDKDLKVTEIKRFTLNV